ncbi:MAG: hypothetical protein KY393_08995, partial [Actinobacteria bacterium]|nr:hypothetical protein [Actinomycetota bacterium]
MSVSVPPAVTSLDLPLKRLGSGKVREIFELDGERLLLVATDRISAYDVVMDQGIPEKGRVLTGMTRFWLDRFTDICPNHLISMKLSDLPEEIHSFADELAGRFMIVRRLNMMPVEFVIRGYLVGSGWKEYRQNGTIAGLKLPEGLKEADKLYLLDRIKTEVFPPEKFVFLKFFTASFTFLYLVLLIFFWKKISLLSHKAIRYYKDFSGLLQNTVQKLKLGT